MNITNTNTPPFPMEITTNILLRLPPKPLARMKSVSKPFNTLISSREFILSHILYSHSSSPNINLALFSNNSILSTLTIHPPTPNHSVQTINPITLPYSHTCLDADLIGSCHGILAISDYPTSLSLFNPTTQTFRIIPLSPNPNSVTESHWVDFGFGHDPLSDTYKIVRVDQLNGRTATPPPRHVTVFNVPENGKSFHKKWRKITQKFPHFLTHPKGHGQLLQDSLFFMSSVNPPAVYEVHSSMSMGRQADKTVYKYVIVKFHLGEEKLTVLKMPVFGRRRKVFPQPTLSVLGGKLSVQIEHGPDKDRTVELWVRKEEEWVKLFSFDYQRERPAESVRVKPVGIIKVNNDNVVLMEEMGRSYFWYSVTDGAIKDVVVDGHFSKRFMWAGGHAYDFGAIDYVESLICLDNCGLGFIEEGRKNNGDSYLGLLRRFITSGSGWVGSDGQFHVPIVGYVEN